MAKKPIKVGDVVACTFLDHAENSKTVMEFIVYGEVTAITRTAYQIHSWSYVHDIDRERDNNAENETWFNIVKKAVKEISALK